MNKNRWLSLLSPLLLLLIWEGAVQVGWLNRIFYPPPSEVFVTLGALIRSGEIARDVGISLLRIGAGFLLGGIPAVIVGLLMGVNPLVRALVQPLAAAIYPIPKIALLPLVIVALGLGEASKIATIAVSVFFLVVLNVAASVLQIDAHYFEVARTFGAKPRDLFWTVALPASLPGIMTSIKLGMGFALTLIVGVEFVGAESGIGWLIWQAYEVYAIDRMLAGLVVIALVGWLITVLLDEVEYLLIPWQRANTRTRDVGLQQQVQRWMGALRAWSYTGTIIPVALGTAIAAYTHGAVTIWRLALVLAGTLTLQTGTNLLNDYFDYARGTDGSGALVRGELRPRQALLGGLLAFVIGAAIGLYLVSVAGMFIFWIGLVGVLVGFFYTAGPFALAYNGLGEVAVFTFMGPVMVIGSYYVQTETLTLPVVLASLPVGFLVAAILHANNLRDLDSDRMLGKRTLATLLGREGSNVEYYVLIGGTYLSLLLAVALGSAPWLTLISVLTLPSAVRLARRVAASADSNALQPVLRQTTLLHLQFGGLLVVGWAAAWMLGMMG